VRWSFTPPITTPRWPQEPVERIYSWSRSGQTGLSSCHNWIMLITYLYFENRARHRRHTVHPHGQIYAYPLVPPKIATELEQSQKHKEQTGRCLLCDIVAEEKRDGRRIVQRER